LNEALPSWKATIPIVQQFGRSFPEATVVFLKGSAFPTSTSAAAREMSDDRKRWTPLPQGIGKVTGRLPAGGLVIGELELIAHDVDLGDTCNTRSLPNPISKALPQRAPFPRRLARSPE
jgi:hypothetical protein